MLRAPRLDDAKAIAPLANDRRIAENTLRIPHPYALADAETFIARRKPANGEIAFADHARDGAVLGGCGIAQLDGDDTGDRLLARRPVLGPAATPPRRRAPLIDHAFGDLGHDTLLARRAREQPGLAPGAGEMRLPVDRRRALSHPRARSSAPIDRFRLDRGLWASLKSWGKVR